MRYTEVAWLVILASCVPGGLSLTGRKDSIDRDIASSVWRMISSMRLALWLLFALLLCMALASLLPQIPPGLDGPSRTEWMQLAAQRLGRLYPALSASGLLDVFHSPFFAALVVVLVLNTAACTLHRARSLLRDLRQGHMAALGTLVTHLAVIGLALSVAASQAFSWQHTTLPIAHGKSHAIPRMPGWSIRNDGLHLVLNQQQTLGYTAQVSLLLHGQLLHQGEIRPNAPLRAARTGVWLISYEPGVAVKARDKRDQPLILQDAAGQSTTGWVFASLSSGPAVFSLPSAGMDFLVSAPQSPLGQERFALTVQRVSTGELLCDREVQSGLDVGLGEIFLTLQAAPYGTYGIKHDPAAAVLLVSALALVIGTSLTLFSGKGRPL